MTIRRLRRDEVDGWRDLRLRMLTESPAAFGTTLETALAAPHEEWVARTEALATGSDRAMFVADEAGELVAGAGAVPDPDDAAVPHLVAMWVAPQARGRGVGRGLVEAVIDWARELGAPSIRLFVVDHNAGALALYERCGFRQTGHLVPLPRDPSVMEVEMRLDLRT